ncbi:MAG: hypothetical protein AB8B99_21015 [Phormidesmis sp.]
MYAPNAWLSRFQHSLTRPLSLPLSLAASATLAFHSAAIASPGSTAEPLPAAPLPTAPLSEASVHRTLPAPTSALTRLTPTLSKISKTTKPTTAFSANKANVYAGELSIAGVTLSSTEDDILWLLGPPKSREVMAGSFIDEILYYGGISISLAGGQVWDIIATSPKFCTPSGVCPGDSVSRVFNTFGPTDIIGQRAVYTASGMGSCVIDLSIAYDAVSQIQLVCQ